MRRLIPVLLVMGLLLAGAILVGGLYVIDQAE